MWGQLEYDTILLTRTDTYLLSSNGGDPSAVSMDGGDTYSSVQEAAASFQSRLEQMLLHHHNIGCSAEGERLEQTFRYSSRDTPSTALESALAFEVKPQSLDQ